MTKYIFALLFGISFMALDIDNAHASEIFFGSSSKEIPLGDEFEVGVFFNSQGEDINAIDSKIIFPSEYANLISVKDGNSILTLWIDKPHEISEGEAYFSGIIPGGYNQNNGYLLSLTF